MKEQATLTERLERRFKEREDARIPFPQDQESFARTFPELAAVWEEWFPRLAPKLARAISGNLMLIEDAGGFGELTILIERHRVRRIGLNTSANYENGRRHGEAEEGDDRRP